MNTLLLLAEALTVAYVMQRVARRLGFPAVTGYVAGGILLGGSFLIPFPWGRWLVDNLMLSAGRLDNLEVVTRVALGIVAVAIGADLQLHRLRRIGRSIALIVAFESLGACLLVFASIVVLWPEHLATALVLGAVASATAPAATLAVIHECRARGVLTNTILGVVGLDDAAALIIFTFCSAAAKSLLGHTSLAFGSVMLRPAMIIAVSLVTGAVAGGISALLISRERNREMLLILTSMTILLASGLAIQFGASQLLSCMAAGFVVVNINPFVRNRLREAIRMLGPVFYALFFIIGGAHLNTTLIMVVGGVSVVYFLARASGKFAGAWLGATLGGAVPRVRRYVGLSLLPQVGVALALAMVVSHDFGSGAYGPGGVRLADTVVNVLLFTTILTELIGPILTRRSLIRAGEAHIQPQLLDTSIPE
ncbi:MAG TPA: sodium:proton exchanger [Kiritimatiellae bacterium]|nr:sodium:proton exchanger [Kiritimatiellia bacterium]